MRMRTLCFLLLPIAVAVSLSGCQPRQTSPFQADTMMLEGDFLFEGPNSLQVGNPIKVEAISKALNLSAEPSSVRLEAAAVSLASVREGLVESLTLQVMSKNHDMLTVAALNPVNGNEATLQVAEETELLPYLSDEGAFWVLDANISADHEEVLQLPLTLQLTVTHP